MRISALLGIKNAGRWFPIERLLFVAGWFATATLLLVAVALEFSNHSSWVYQLASDKEFTRPLPSDAELVAQAQTLPSNAVRFRYDAANTDLLGLTTKRTYVGFYDPLCQKPIDIKRKACAKIGFPLLSNGSELHCFDSFSINLGAPADRCVLWSYGDHYLMSVTNTYWNMDRLFGNQLFLFSFAIAIACFSNFFLMRLIWFPLWRWIAA